MQSILSRLMDSLRDLLDELLQARRDAWWIEDRDAAFACDPLLGGAAAELASLARLLHKIDGHVGDSSEDLDVMDDYALNLV